MTNATLSSVSERVTLHGIACLVALCSFAYELVYSELLTVIYGGTVTQYGLTIGLFFSSLGIGSFFVRHFADAQHSNFFRTEVQSITSGLSESVCLGRV
jgi:spermidine synthase